MQTTNPCSLNKMLRLWELRYIHICKRQLQLLWLPLLRLNFCFEQILQIHWKPTVLAPECAETPEFTAKEVFTALAHSLSEWGANTTARLARLHVSRAVAPGANCLESCFWYFARRCRAGTTVGFPFSLLVCVVVAKYLQRGRLWKYYSERPPTPLSGEGSVAPIRPLNWRGLQSKRREHL